jgi:hypothetical protein
MVETEEVSGKMGKGSNGLTMSEMQICNQMAEMARYNEIKLKTLICSEILKLL